MDYDVEEVPNPDHVHVLEVLPPEQGETEGKRVEVNPCIGKFLLEHQVKTAFTRKKGGGLRGK